MRTRRILTLVVAWAACCMAAATMAQGAIGFLDSSAFDFKYEMDVDPSNATLIDLDVPTGNSLSDFINWQTPAIMTGTTPTDGSYLELTPEAETTYGDAIASDLWDVGDGIWQNSGITDASGYTVEMSVKIGEPRDETMMGSGSLNATVANGPSAWVSYGQEGLFWGGSAGALQIDATSNADDAYHSIRIIKEPGLDQFWVYRDGVVVNEIALTGFGDARGMLTAGCMSGLTIGTSEVDYLRFTPGAYVEVGAELPPAPPEPDPRPVGTTLFLDSFNTVTDPAGINDELGAPRQSGPAVPVEGIGYVDMTEGSTAIAGSELIFTAGGSGANTTWLDKSFTDLADSEYGVSAKMIFEPGQNASSWSAIILNEAETSDVVADADLIFLARASGWWRVYAGGAEVAGDDGSTLVGAPEYDVYMSVDETGVEDTYNIWVGDVQLVTDGMFTADTGETGDRYFGLRYYSYGAGQFTTFDDFTIETIGAVADKLPGDANNDGVVDDLDAAELAANWQTLTGATWAMGDFNNDGAVDDIDATILATNWQTGAAGASVPEPSTIVALLALVLAGFAARGRRRNA